MTGLDHKRADLSIREVFALSKEGAGQVLSSIKQSEGVGGCVIISTCNRTEFYASVADSNAFEPTETLCRALQRSSLEFKPYFTERAEEQAIAHLCRVAAGLDSQIIGDDQIITQAREALEISRGYGCTDSYLETMFKTAIHAAKAIKTQVTLKTIGIDSVPEKTVEVLEQLCPLAGQSAVVIGNGQMGRHVCELLICAGVQATVTIREYKKKVVVVPHHAATIPYSERYEAIEEADIVVSATTSPHFTVYHEELSKLSRYPSIIVDLAVPRDVEPCIADIPGIRLLTIDDISGESRVLPPESLLRIEEIIAEEIENYNRWFDYKKNAELIPVGGTA